MFPNTSLADAKLINSTFYRFFTTEKLEDRISQQMKLHNIIRPSYIQQQAIRNKSGSAYHGGNNPCSA